MVVAMQEFLEIAKHKEFLRNLVTRKGLVIEGKASLEHYERKELGLTITIDGIEAGKDSVRRSGNFKIEMIPPVPVEIGKIYEVIVKADRSFVPIRRVYV